MEKSKIKSQISNINLCFTHFVDVPRCDCTIGTARNNDTNRLKVYLIVNHRGPIYSRNGLSDTWVALNTDEQQQIRELAQVALEQGVARYSTNHAALN